MFTETVVKKYCSTSASLTADEMLYAITLILKYNLNWYVIAEKWFDVNERKHFSVTYNKPKVLIRAKTLVELKVEFIRLCKLVFQQVNATEKPDLASSVVLPGYFKSLLEKMTCKMKNLDRLQFYVQSTDFKPKAESIRIELLDKQQKRSKEDTTDANVAVDAIGELDKNIAQYERDIADLKKNLGLDDEVSAEYLKKHSSLVNLFLETYETPSSERTLQAIHSKKKRYKLRTGVCFRSSTLVAPPSEIGIGPALVTKISKILEVVGLSRRVMATHRTCQGYNNLRLNILKLVVLTKELHRIKDLRKY